MKRSIARCMALLWLQPSRRAALPDKETKYFLAPETLTLSPYSPTCLRGATGPRSVAPKAFVLERQFSHPRAQCSVFNQLAMFAALGSNVDLTRPAVRTGDDGLSGRGPRPCPLLDRGRAVFPLYLD